MIVRTRITQTGADWRRFHFLKSSIEVNYDGVIVGEYYADLLVNGAVILELKAAESISKQHEAQLINYLKALNIDVGLILNYRVNHYLW